MNFYIRLNLSEIDLFTDGKPVIGHFYSKVFQALGVIRKIENFDGSKSSLCKVFPNKPIFSPATGPKIINEIKKKIVADFFRRFKKFYGLATFLKRSKNRNGKIETA